MLQTQHISFKDWNPIGKPNWKKPHSSGDDTSKSLGDVNLKGKNSPKNKDSFGQAATLELSEAGIEKALSANKISTYKITSRTLKVGCKGDDVRALQINLKKLGYNVGTSDGIYGSSTRNAVILFQRAYGLSGDGIAEKNTLDAIDYTVRQKNNNILSKGQVGSEVANLQKKLITLGYFSGKSDGVFGKDTESAVVTFQKRYGLTANGLVGNDTRYKIEKAIASNQSSKTNHSGTVRNVPIDNNYKNKNVDMNNAKYVYDELIKAGFSKESAAAVMGNLDVEHSFSTSWKGDQGSVGIAQWRGSRKTDLEAYAKRQNGDVTDIKIQTSFLINVDMEKRLGKEGLKNFKKMTDYIDATDYFCDKFESPSSYKSREEWLKGKYGPDYAKHGGTYKIEWERYEWSEQLQKYELDLKKRRSASHYWYNNKR